MDPEFYELMPNTIAVKRYTGEDSFGNNTYGTSANFLCRIDDHQRQLGGGASRSGTMVQASSLTTTIYTDYTTPPFTVRDHITLPDGSTPSITNVQVEYDEVGPHHQVITCEDTRE